MAKPGKLQKITLDGRDYAYNMRKSRRARRLLLHVDISGTIEVVLPYWVPYREGSIFVKSKQGWLLEQLKAQSRLAQSIPRYQFVTGERIPCLGDYYELVVVSPERVRTTLTQNNQTLTIRGRNPRRALQRWYTVQAKLFFEAQVAELVEYVGTEDVSVRVNSAQSQWGSCNATQKNISFTWRLALAPPEIARYVAAHEVAHLRYAGHGKRFWQLVSRLDPEYMQHKKYLKERGYTLTL